MRTSLFQRSPTPLPPPPLPRCLAKPCGIATLLHHHHAVVLLLDGVFPNLSLSPCWIKAWETSPGCTCVERGGTVLRCLIGRAVETYDYINQVNASVVDLQGYIDYTLPLSLLCITMILCVHRNFFEITTFPNRWHLHVQHTCSPVTSPMP